jgi:hypothetical protein
MSISRLESLEYMIQLPHDHGAYREFSPPLGTFPHPLPRSIHTRVLKTARGSPPHPNSLLLKALQVIARRHDIRAGPGTWHKNCFPYVTKPPHQDATFIPP